MIAIALFLWSRLKYDFNVVLYKHGRCSYNSIRRVIKSVVQTTLLTLIEAILFGNYVIAMNTLRMAVL